MSRAVVIALALTAACIPSAWADIPRLRGIIMAPEEEGHGKTGAAPADAVSGCIANPAQAAGNYYTIMMHDGIPRRYLVHVPPQAAANPGKPLPAVFNFHGMPYLNEFSEILWSGMNAKADKEGYYVVYPTGFLGVFNAGDCCSYADDVGFVRNVVAELQRDYCVDTRRLYATGISGGGMMTYRMGCEAADIFAAVSSVGGARIINPCVPSRPVPLIHFHGTADMRVPYGGSETLFGLVTFPPVEEEVRDWAVNKNGCTSGPTEMYRNDRAMCRTWTGCKEGSDVVLCTVEGMGHCWPGGDCPFTWTSPGLDDINADDALWEFFMRFQLPLNATKKA